MRGIVTPKRKRTTVHTADPGRKEGRMMLGRRNALRRQECWWCGAAEHRTKNCEDSVEAMAERAVIEHISGREVMHTMLGRGLKAGEMGDDEWKENLVLADLEKEVENLKLTT